MKTSTLLFFGAFLAMFAFDFLYSFTPKAKFIERGAEGRYVQQVLANLDNPIDARQSPTEERNYRVGYIMRATVMPGIRLVHDPSLGKEIIARGPAAALDVLSFKAKEGRLRPDFTQAVIIDELVEVRVNLEAHGSERMRISTKRPSRRTALHAEFTTTGPLSFRFLEIINAGNKKIEVAVKDLLLWSHNPTDNIYGKATRLEILDSDGKSGMKEAPNLSYDEIIRTPYKDVSEKLEKAFPAQSAKDSNMIATDTTGGIADPKK